MSRGNSTSYLAGRDPDNLGFADLAYSTKIYNTFTGWQVEFADAAHGDYRLTANSGGTAADAPAGYHVYDATQNTVGFNSDASGYIQNTNVTLKANLFGAYAGATCNWTVSDGKGHEVQGAGNPFVTTLATTGTYSVALSVAGRATPFERTNLFCIALATNEVKTTDSLVEAVNAAEHGTVIKLADGEHVLTAVATVTKDVRIVGSGYTNCTLRQTTAGRRVVDMRSRGAVLEGVTVTGGSASECRQTFGGGLRILGDGGTARCCRFTDNKVNNYDCYGGGVGVSSVSGLVSHCVIDLNNNNHSTANGGGAYVTPGTLDNCLIVGNKAAGGGGIAIDTGARLLNCTISGNTALTSRGGGIRHLCGNRSTVYNCVIAGNTADSDTGTGKPEWGMDRNEWALKDYMKNCLFSSAGVAIGTDYKVDAAPFMDAEHGDYSLKASSTGVDGGFEYDGIASVDLAGHDRIIGKAPDIGCYEYDTTKVSCDFTVSPLVVWAGESVTLTNTVIGGEGKNLAYDWTLTDDNGNVTKAVGPGPTVTLSKGGQYSVKLVVLDADQDPPKKLAEAEHANSFRVVVRNVYVKPENPNIKAPYDSWETAHTNILELMECVADGCTIHVGEGTNVVSDVIEVKQALTFTGAGMDKTWVRYDRSNGSKRVFLINNKDAVVERMTICNGKGGAAYSEWGGGVLIDASGGTLQDCRVTENTTGTYYIHGAGVGVYGVNGSVKRCIIDHNEGGAGNGSFGGLALYAGHAENCLVYSNKSTSAAGLYAFAYGGMITVSNCTFVANEATSYGAGGLCLQYTSNMRLVNCIFAGNKGVTYAPSSDRYVIDPNEVELIWGSGWTFPNVQACAAALSDRAFNCCFQMDDPGYPLCTDALFTTPRFVDAANLDFHLKPSASAIDGVNGGKYAPWMLGATDLDGRKRVKKVIRGKGRVDMGCYESDYWPVGLMLLVR